MIIDNYCPGEDPDDDFGGNYFAYSIGRCPIDPWAPTVVLMAMGSERPIVYCPECGVALEAMPPESTEERNRLMRESHNFYFGSNDILATDHYDDPIFDLHELAPAGARWATESDIQGHGLGRARLVDITEVTQELVNRRLEELRKDRSV